MWIAVYPLKTKLYNNTLFQVIGHFKQVMHGLKDNIVKSSLLFKNQLLKTPIGQPLFWIMVGNVADMDHYLSFCFQDSTNQENGQTNIICYILWNGSCCCLHARWESILIKTTFSVILNIKHNSNFAQCKSP